MGDKGLGVIIRTILSNDVKDIEMQIKQLSGKIKERLELRLKINAEDLKVITKEVEKVQQKVNAVIKNQNIKLDTSNIAPNIDKVTQKYTQMAGQSQKLVQETTQYVNQLGQAVKVVDTIDKETQHTVKSTQLITENYKAQRTEAEKLAMFQQKMLGFGGLKGELDIFSEKFKGKYDESALAKLRKDIESLTPSTANLNKKMKESSTAFSLLKQDAAESGNVLTRTFENAYKFLRFYLVGGLLVRFVSTIREGINTVKELDEAITNMRITMNLSSGEFDRMALSAQKLAKELGSTVAEVLEA